MDDLVTESLPELLELALAGLASVALTLVGAVVELAAAGNLATGRTGLGVWELALGGLLLYAGVYLLGYRRVARTLLAGRHLGP